MLEPYQEKIVVEKSELDAKVTALDEFIQGPRFAKASELEQTLLRNQLKSMMEYSSILGQRISLWRTP